MAKQPKVPPQPKPLITKAPKTCKDQCDVIEKICTDPCEKKIKGNAQAMTTCKQSCKNMTDACMGSCKEKGKVDAEYVKDHYKPPKLPKPPPGAKIRDEDHDDH